MAFCRTRVLVFVVAASVCRMIPAHEAVTISVDGSKLSIQATSTDRLQSGQTRTGLVLWDEEGYDRWDSLSNWKSGQNLAPADSANLLLAGSRGDAPGSQQAIAVTTQPIDQFLGGEIVRDVKPGGIICPPEDGVVANPQITIRRMPRDQQPEYPTDEYVLVRGKTELTRIPIAAGANSVKWSNIGTLPPNLRDGLPPGKYLLESKANDLQVSFTVLPADVWKKISSRSGAIAKLTSNRADSALAAQLLAEELLGYSADDKAAPLVADALDSLDETQRTKYLEQVHQKLRLQLAGNLQPKQVTNDPTGIEAIDTARNYIARGQWRHALDELNKIGPDAPNRERGLAQLYAAVIFAESGPATGDQAAAGFQAAIETLQSGSPSDLFRARYNLANFLLRRAQDRLYNHAFQAATGGRQPLFGALADWIMADQQLAKADSLAAQVGPGAVAAIEVNVAREYTLLADIINVLNSAVPTDKRFIEGEQKCIERALEAASKVVNSPGDSSDSRLSTAIAHEILAQLAYRQADFVRCLREAAAAREIYLDEGFLVGVEGIERLTGLVNLRQSKLSADKAAQFRSSALQHFLLSHELAEALRDRFPTDVVGQTRAGFLARRAYVNEKIIEIYLANGQPREALQAAEAAKSRALNDVLMLQQRASLSGLGDGDRFDLDQIKWPEDSIALEYFLGSEHAWLFVIRGTKVQAFPLVDAQKQAVESHRLIADVTRFLLDTESTAEKMSKRIGDGRPLDVSWQNQLHAFYNTLIPAEARAEIARAKTLVIVPHHVLHYFPFAALVRKTDSRPRTVKLLPEPQFLIDQGQAITYAPSLAAWAALRNKPHIARRVNAVSISEFASAKPLEGAKKDMVNLQSTFGGMVANVAQDNDATEEKLSAMLREPGLTFIGTHGMNVADQPLESFLLCQPGNGDGRLMAGELYQNTSASDVVVLSACYSGLGDRSPMPGDDLFGLQRAMLHTGVGTVVAGLWDVFDSSGVEIMKIFFKEVHSGQPIPNGLANAQRTFLAAQRAEPKENVWIHPYFWAVYKSTGSDLSRIAATSETK